MYWKWRCCRKKKNIKEYYEAYHKQREAIQNGTNLQNGIHDIENSQSNTPNGNIIDDDSADEYLDYAFKLKEDKLEDVRQYSYEPFYRFGKGISSYLKI